MTKAEIDRINELAHKQKAKGLSADELIEQKKLREKFLAEFRENFKRQLDNIEIVEPDDPRLKKQIWKQPEKTAKS